MSAPPPGQKSDIVKETHEAVQRSQSQSDGVQKARKDRIEEIRRAAAERTLRISGEAIGVVKSAVPLKSAKGTLMEEVKEDKLTLTTIAQIASPLRSTMEGIEKGLSRHIESGRQCEAQSAKNSNIDPTQVQAISESNRIADAFKEVSDAFKGGMTGVHRPQSGSRRNEGQER